MNDSTSRGDILNEFEIVGRTEAAPAGSDAPFEEEKYLPELENADLTDEQKSELLQALWSIMKTFVDLGFGVNSIHRFLPELAAESSESEADRVESENQTCRAQFEDTADSKGAEEGPS